MKLAAIALDYDGTIADEGAMDPGVRSVIDDLRSRGIRIALVTGRRLDDLRRVAGDLTCFDVIVGENGAILHFPDSARHARLAHPPVPAFIHELTRRGVVFTAGEAIVEADATSAPAILSVIRALELPLMLSFNGDRVMVLPPAISKSTGLRRALQAFRISAHNALGIGNAENDHDLLDACEVGAAVEWGSQALCRVADDVIPGSAPAAVADYLRDVASQPRQSASQMGRRRLVLGHEADGKPLAIAVRGRTILITGELGTGKSWLAGLLCEQLILQGYGVCVIDPDGDYHALDGLPGVHLLGGQDRAPDVHHVTRLLRHPDVSAVIDLSSLPRHAKVDYVASLLPVLNAQRRATGLPHRVLLDNACDLLPGTSQTHMVDADLGGYILITRTQSKLDPALRVPGETVMLVTGEAGEHEVSWLSGAGAYGETRRFTAAPRLTSHARSSSP